MKSGDFDVNNLLEDDDVDLKEELWACQLFLVVDCELEEGKHRVFNFAVSTCDNSLINKKLDLVIKGLKCAAKVTLRLELFVLHTGSCRSFYAHENNTVMEKSKVLCTPDDIPNLKENLQKTDFVDLRTQKRVIPNGCFTN